jgi:A/G-specific adenine glycosylase
MVSDAQIKSFLEIAEKYYARHARDDLPWRRPEPDGSFSSYKILVSELMLQQTQVARVVPKYTSFLEQFPTVDALAAAELGEVLRAWQGLGYNRRAKYLWTAAKQIAAEGWPEDLTELPGVGVNTAGAVKAYAFNQPTVFIETNIRTVYIYHFAPNEQNVPDSFIRDLLARSVELVNDEGKNAVLSHAPRVFYWALMDYGSYLKTQVQNLSQSKQYKRQPAFQGSKRQIRGLVIRELSRRSLSLAMLQAAISDERLGDVLAELDHEGFITKRGNIYQLSP